MAVRVDVLHGERLADDSILLVLREVGGERCGAIRMNFAEIASVLAAQQGISGQRPSAHLAWAQMVRSAGITLEQLIIHGYSSEDELLCLLRFRLADRAWTVDCRPSDGIALALRLEAPIICEEHVLNHMAAGNEEREKDTSKQWLEYFKKNDDIPKA